MLFGQANPWQARRQQQMQPTGQFPIQQQQPSGIMHTMQQPPQQFAAPTWPGQTPDGAYSLGLAQHWAGQMANQQVPGTVLPPMQQPPVAAPPMGAPPMDQRGAFQQARQDWRQDRPEDHDLMKQWHAARPTRSSFF